MTHSPSGAAPSRATARADLEAEILSVEAGIVEREARLRREVQALGGRLRSSFPKKWGRGALAGLGASLGAGLLFSLWRPKRHAAPIAAHLPAWSKWITLAWPFVPAHIRSRVDPRLISMLTGVGLPALERLFRSKATPQVEPRVDLGRYAGRWFEIGRIPDRFEKFCRGDVTAEYVSTGADTLRVLNRCIDKVGQERLAVGEARVVPGSGNARLKVDFLPSMLRWLPGNLGKGDYWILKVDADYQVALVGSPNRRYLWVLSRQPRIDEAQLKTLVDYAKSQGYDTRLLRRTPQSSA